MNDNDRNQSITLKYANFDSNNGGVLSVPKFANQFPIFNSPDQKDQICDIVIGFDFGSSCTKVVLQAPYIGWASVVPFKECGYHKNKNFLPTKIYCDPLGRFSLLEMKDAKPFSGLKTDLLKNPDKTIKEDIEQFQIELTSKIIAIAYIASVLQEVRHWFLSTQYDIFSSYKIRWHLNIGIPSAGYNDSEKKELFQNIAQIAWSVSTIHGKIKLKNIKKALNYGKIKKEIEGNIYPEDITVIPEVAAEVVGYARSSLKEPGLHVLIDVGARTLDIASFELYDRDGEANYRFLTAALDELGATIYYYNCLKSIINDGSDISISRYYILINMIIKHTNDLIAPVPTSISSYFPGSKINEKEMNQDFYKKCYRLIHTTILDLKKRRDPKSDRWNTGLPIFLCGGGKNIELYRKAIEQNHDWLRHYTDSKGLIIRKIPKPAKLKAENLDNEDYHRFAVAYGLSFPSYDIGEIKPPKDIDDIPCPEPKDYSDRFIAKEHV